MQASAAALWMKGRYWSMVAGVVGVCFVLCGRVVRGGCVGGAGRPTSGTILTTLAPLPWKSPHTPPCA